MIDLLTILLHPMVGLNLLVGLQKHVEVDDAPVTTVKTWIERILKLMKGYELKNIGNMDV